MDIALISFFVLLFVVAFLYSSVGHGGASSYLALMAIFGISSVYMRSSALTLNVFVSAIAWINYTKAGFFRYKIILPFILSSVPLAFIGAMIHVPSKVYAIVLGVFLLLATARMLFISPPLKKHTAVPFLSALIIGAVLGFFSGLIGIGGGIILSPLLILLGWANIKEAAAVSALFIFVNSLSGLIGVFYSGAEFIPLIWLWILLALSGGLAGAYLGSRKFSPGSLKYVLAFILCTAALKLLFF
jgi:uncharacterized protein